MLVRQEMSAALEAFGIEVQAGHHEGAPSQHEIDFRYDHALKSADAALTFRYVLKAIAQERGLYATLCPNQWRDRGIWNACAPEPVGP